MNSTPISAAGSSAVGGPAQFNAPGYALHSDLAQFCLPAANRDVNRILAYVNSICSLFLAIGLAGINPPALEQSQEGTVTLIIGVKPDGSVESVEVKTSSGHVTLDRAAVQHVKTKYKFLPISTDEIRYFEKDIQYQLQ